MNPKIAQFMDAPILGVDTETKDPHICKYGPGHFDPDAYMVGVSLASPDGKKVYLPLRHEGGGNLPLEETLADLRELLARPMPKVGAAIMYDVGFLAKDNIELGGTWIDVAGVEALIDENRHTYSLNSLATRYLGVTKTEDALYQWCAAHFGGQPTRRAQIGNIWRAPAWVVNDYAEDDALLPLQILEKQRPILEEQGLLDVFDLECRTLKVLWYMRKTGARVDIDNAEKVKRQLDNTVKTNKQRLRKLAGFDVNVNASASLARLFDEIGLAYPSTDKGNPSFTKQFLETVDHPAAKTVLNIREAEKISGTFIDNIIDRAVDGRLHTEYHPLPNGHNGAVSGRLSSSNPNLQNIPSRNKVLAPLVRGLFLPEPGERWAKIDYSQIEPRLTVHYSKHPVAMRLKRLYAENPSMNCYKSFMSLLPGGAMAYFMMKIIYLGITYGMGVAKLAAQLGVTEQEAKALRDTFKSNLPFIHMLANQATRAAEARGFVKTLLGRRARFDLWEPREWTPGAVAAPRETALEKYGVVRRAFCYKALNRIIQGGAADILKKALVEIHEAGVLDVITLLLTVHDENDFSYPRTPAGKEALGEAKHIMETVVDLDVPLLADLEIGPDWGHVRKVFTRT